MPRPNYETVRNSYPGDQLHQPCPDVSTSVNHCALRMSIALAGAGFTLGSDFTANKCRHNLARGASDLAAYLQTKWGNRDLGFSSPGSLPSTLSGKNGVIFFETIPGFSGQGHIDVFDGTVGKTGTYWNAAVIWFWKLPLQPSVNPDAIKI